MRPGGPVFHVDPPERPTPEEAAAMRRWIVGTTVAAVMIIGTNFTTSAQDDLVIAAIATATFATGALTTRRPKGFRMILLAAALAGMAVLVAAMTAT